MLNDDFQKVLDEYLNAREENGYTSAPIAHHIQQTLKNEVSDLVEDSTYKITASAGVGRLSEIPWIGVYKPDNDNNISSGYLFKADMTGVYLVLRVFHYTELEEKYGIFVPEHLRTKAIHIKALLENSPFDINYFDETFDLNSKSKTADIHKSGMILCKLYEKDNIPSEEILKNDLKQIIKIQDYIYDNYSDNMYLTVDEWIEALEDENLIDKKTLNILEINYNFEDHTASYDDIIKKREELGYPNEKTYNSNIVNTSKRLKERFNKTEIYGHDEKEIWVPRFFYGARRKNQEGKRVFYNTLREELVEALENYDKSKRPDRIKIDMPPKDTTSKKTERGSESIQYWLIAAGEDSIWWDDFKRNNEIGINFPGTGDVKYKTPEEILRGFQEENNDDGKHTNVVKACLQFAHDIQIGDVVFVKEGNSTIIGRGIIESDYNYDSSKPYSKFRKIKWTHEGSWDYEGTFPQKTLTDITDKPYLEIIKKFFENKEYDSFYDYLRDEGYYFSRETIENYLLSLKVKPFVILTGNSGTGKTKLSLLFAEYLQKKYSQYKSGSNNAIVPVGANWTENRNVVGYYNVLTHDYQHTQSLDLLLDADNDKKYPYFLILDEMNLSHVERYFSDFLSAMESRKPMPLHNATEEKINVPNEMKIPENVFIVGTVNIDETTYMFSPKVLDRSNVLEFKTFKGITIEDYINNNYNEGDFLKGNLDYLENPLSDFGLREEILLKIHDGFDKTVYEITVITQSEDNPEDETTFKEKRNVLKKLTSELTRFNEILQGSGFEFGYRTINEILSFMYVAWKYEGAKDEFNNWKRYFDAQILQKILPKLHGSQLILGGTLDELLAHCLGSESINETPKIEDITDKSPYPESSKKLIQMKNTLEKQRYVSFIN